MSADAEDKACEAMAKICARRALREAAEFSSKGDHKRASDAERRAERALKSAAVHRKGSR